MAIILHKKHQKTSKLHKCLVALPQYNRIPINVLCAYAKTKTLNSYWFTKMDNVKLEQLTPILTIFWQLFMANILVIYKIENTHNGP